MKVWKERFLFCVVLLAILLPNIVQAGPFIAYSLREAERWMKSSWDTSAELMEIGGITQIAGMVYNQSNEDLIIVGQVNKGNQKITLDDFVVALRSILLHNEYPLVSIDRTEDTPKTGKQIVHFKGKVENTQFGKDMLDADIVLKKLSLGLLRPEPWGVQSYFSMSLDQLKKKMVDSSHALPTAKAEDAKYYFAMSSGKSQSSDTTLTQAQQKLVDYFRIGSRFWFYPFDPAFVLIEGVFVNQKLDVGVRTEVLYACIKGNCEDDIFGIKDEIGDKFAAQMVANYSNIRKPYLELSRVKTLYDLTSLAKGIKELLKELPAKPDLSYWLNNYKVKYVFTDTTYDLITGVLEITAPDLPPQLLEISGGMELNPHVLWLNAGDVTVLKEAVLNAKPKKPNVLTWHVPLEGWEIPGADKYYDIPKEDSTRSHQKAGFSLDVKVITTGTSKYNTEELVTPYLNPSPASMPNFKINGVYIAPVPKSEGKPRNGLWENFLKNVLMSRPSPDTPFWEIEKIPGTEE